MTAMINNKLCSDRGREVGGEGGIPGGGRTSMMTQSDEKCPPDTLKFPYECLVSILCGGNDK